MARLIFIILSISLFSSLTYAYDYEARRRSQARDSGELSLEEPKQEQKQNINQTNEIKKQKTVLRRKNQKKLRANRKMGRGNYPPNAIIAE